ncbi:MULTISPECIES: ankyrin repeat domain-containing protein [Xanthomonas]|uniref:ankyrin repeat domain-containing protein n=1 Tax=Xanthomonas TaxID=338 RepID=UPI00158D2FD5|nr:ankyrin repeat domain-containing protein [Xanthomonas campestris]MCC5091928.1 ankyrin repeat domain-containing protein [Xanthomonas campestris pv. incanae]MEA9609705.1 ankyrin repeat domain-containing protein [Xanthomonas campestris pv. incanae]MEA9619051.1 ankyrin repeat domain-containing protein [Xanthomonas campestris pv. incanae]WDJ12138.1 ankyrin repeat domain-containing protein [Xanthomonas campestris pv. incanae]
MPQRHQECDQEKEISMQTRFPTLLVLATSFFAVSCTASPGAKEQTTMSATLQDHAVAFRDPGLTDIANAIAHGDIARIKTLAPTVDLAAHGDQNVTLLEWAIWNEQPRALDALLDAGADPALPGMDQETVVHMAAMAQDPQYLKILLQHKAPIDVVSARAGWTPLFRAVQSKRDAQIGLLLDAGADVQRVDHTGNSLLHLAAQSGASSPTVLQLLKAGVDPTVRNAQQKTFQAYFFTTPDRLLNATGRQVRSDVRAWLSAHNIPAESSR